MQALIDYDGWRQWKDFSQDARDDDAKDTKVKSIGSGSSGKKKKHRPSAGSSPNASTSHISPKDAAAEPVGLGVDGVEISRSTTHTA